MKHYEFESNADPKALCDAVNKRNTSAKMNNGAPFEIVSVVRDGTGYTAIIARDRNDLDV